MHLEQWFCVGHILEASGAAEEIEPGSIPRNSVLFGLGSGLWIQILKIQAGHPIGQLKLRTTDSEVTVLNRLSVSVIYCRHFLVLLEKGKRRPQNRSPAHSEGLRRTASECFAANATPASAGRQGACAEREEGGRATPGFLAALPAVSPTRSGG